MARSIVFQTIKNKAHKYGIKLFKLCTQNGYTLHTKIYCGKNSDDLNTDASLGHAEKVTFELMDNYLDKEKILYADNFYNGIPLAEHLLNKKTFLCGTLRTNRKGIPLEILQNKLKKGNIIGKQNDTGVKIMKWKDKRDVLMITTVKNHECLLTDTTKKGRGIVVQKPLCVLDYNRVKKGVDISDQLSGYYSTLRRGLKWCRKVVFEIITGTAVINA